MYESTGPGEPRPAPPEPDTPNSGRTHTFVSSAPVQAPASDPSPPEPETRLDAWDIALLVGVWVIAFDVLVKAVT